HQSPLLCALWPGQRRINPANALPCAWTRCGWASPQRRPITVRLNLALAFESVNTDSMSETGVLSAPNGVTIAHIEPRTDLQRKALCLMLLGAAGIPLSL